MYQLLRFWHKDCENVINEKLFIVCLEDSLFESMKEDKHASALY